MEYKVNLENLLAAAYLSGAAEGLQKANGLTTEDINKNLEDLKHLRRTFLNRAEEEGYHEPVHHIEEAKRHAYDLLVLQTKFPNTNLNSVKPLNSVNVRSPSNTNISTAVNAVVNTIPMATTPSYAPPVLSLGGKRRV